MADIPTSEPLYLYAGDTVRWTRTIPEFPASAGWVLSYVLVNAQAGVSITATASGDAFAVEVPSATSAAWAAGVYTWRAKVTLGAEVHTVGAGAVEVLPALGGSPQDLRSFARRALEAVELYLVDGNNLAAAEYQIAGRSLKRHTLPELWAHRDRLKAEVAREDAAARLAAGLPHPGRVYVRFGR